MSAAAFHAVIAKRGSMRRGQRLQRPEQFQRVRRAGKSWSHPLCMLNAAPNRVGRTRCGFVVGKQLGKAHDRNRAKRRMREAVRLQYDRIRAGYDLVFVVRAPVLSAPFATIQHAVADLLQRAGLWVASPTQDDHTQGGPDGPVDRTDPDPRVSALYITPDSA
jgi:ribonuclease P protein component